jgi:hypothetical protein
LQEKQLPLRHNDAAASGPSHVTHEAADDMPLEHGRPSAVPWRAEPDRQELLGVAVKARGGEMCHQLLPPLQTKPKRRATIEPLNNGAGSGGARNMMAVARIGDVPGCRRSRPRTSCVSHLPSSGSHAGIARDGTQRPAR